MDEHQGVSIVRDGKACAVIVINIRDKRIRTAAESLNEYIHKATGAQLPLVDITSAQVHDHLTHIYIGAVALARQPALAAVLQGMDRQGFVIDTQPGAIYIVGPSDWGTVYGVYEFLERYLDVRWLMAGPMGEDVPHADNIVIPQTQVRMEPAFVYRRVTPSTRYPVVDKWVQRNKLQGAYNAPVKFHHNLHSFFPPELYGTTHPEFYPGNKPPAPGVIKRWQPSFTCAGTVDVAVAAICKYFAEHPEEQSISLGVNDIGGYCEEDPAHPQYTGRTNSAGMADMSDFYYAWVNQVVERVTQVYPDTWFGLLAYREVVDPPAFKLHPRVVPFITKDRMAWADADIRAKDQALIDKWRQVADRICWYDYMYGFYYLIPRVYPHLMADNLRYAKAVNTGGLYTEMQYSPGDGPKAWLYARLMWNPNQDVDALLQEWYQRAVGEAAAEDLAAFYAHWESFWLERMTQTPWFEQGKKQTYLNFVWPVFLASVTTADISKCEALLDAVLAKTQTEQQRARALLVREIFNFGVICFRSYAKQVAPPETAQAALSMLHTVVNTYEERLQLAQQRYQIMQQFTGHPDPNLNAEFSAPMWRYWWKHWSGWNRFEVEALVSYARAHEAGGGPLTQELSRLVASESEPVRKCACFLQLALGAHIQLNSLTADHSFEAGAGAWATQAEDGAIRHVRDTAYAGAGCLLFDQVPSGQVTQTFAAKAGLIAVQLRYLVAEAAPQGSIQLELQALDTAGDTVVTYKAVPKPLASVTDTWQYITLIEALPPWVIAPKHEKVVVKAQIAQAKVVVTVKDAHTARVYIDDLVAYQDVPLGVTLS